jgi:hypothetical protein
MNGFIVCCLAIVAAGAIGVWEARGQTQESMSAALMQTYEEQFKALVQTRAALADTQKQLADANAELAKLHAMCKPIEPPK